MGYRKDRIWSDRYLDAVMAILRKHAGLLLAIEVAADAKDRQQATDIVIAISCGDVAVRLRRGDCKYRDLTLRAMRDSGAVTELQKIRDGYARWYFYGWTIGNEIDEWILVDLDKLRTSGLLDNQGMISNQDGTYFIALSRAILHDCIIAEKHKGEE